MPIVGIDLGTSYSSVAAVVDGRPVVIPDAEGDLAQPSVVSFSSDGNVLVGKTARARLMSEPQNTVYSIKRVIGRCFDETETRAFQLGVPFRLAEGPNRSAVVTVRDGSHSIPEISAHVLRCLKRAAERHLKQRVTRAVVTVPANFNDAQRKATCTAARIAGLEVVSVVNEPTAAALAYGYGKALNRTLAVYDFGGGTFDLTLLEVNGPIFRVIATGGDMFLGGDDFDDAIAQHVHTNFWKETSIDLKRDQVEWARLLLAAESCKRELSDRPEAEIRLSRVAHRARGPIDLHARLTRVEFDGLVMGLVKRSLEACTSALETAGVQPDAVHDLLLVGGTTCIPLVRAAAEQHFRRRVTADVDAHTAVATGAALLAATLGGERVSDEEAEPRRLLLDVLPHSIGVVAAGGVTERVIERSTPIPVQRRRVFATSHDDQRTLKIVVVQGEAREAAQNRLLGEMAIEGLRPAPRGHVEVEVAFEADRNGILHLAAREVGSGRVLRKRLRLSEGLREEKPGREVRPTPDSHRP